MNATSPLVFGEIKPGWFEEGMLPELRGFQQTPQLEDAIYDLEWALEEGLGDITEVEDEIRDLHFELTDVEIEIDDLESRKRGIKDQVLEKQGELAKLKMIQASDPLPVPRNFGCTQCSFHTGGLSNADEYHAENHALESGHTVAIVMSLGSQFFEQDRIDLEVQL